MAQLQWGVAVSAYQTEGQPLSGGRSWSVWDAFAHADHGARIKDGSNGDVGCNLADLDQLEQDLQILQMMRVRHFRLSISWSRIFPQCNMSRPNRPGVEYYHSVIRLVKKHDMTPWVTIFHWDTPLCWRDNWAVRERLPEFVQYGLFLVHTFSDVQHWITINEPRTIAEQGYEHGIHAPGYQNRTLSFLVAAHFLQAHRMLYRQVKKDMPEKQLSMALNVDYFGPAHVAEYDAHLWYADALLLGTVPEAIRQENPWITNVALGDGDDGHEHGEYQAFLDFFALNFYSGHDDQHICPPPSEQLASWWLHPCPKALPLLIQDLQSRYATARLPSAFEVVVTETGVSTVPGDAADANVRGRHFLQMADSLLSWQKSHERVSDWTCDKIFMWSYVDNFEWNVGFTERFGMLGMNISAPRRPRCWRDSALVIFPHLSASAMPISRC